MMDLIRRFAATFASLVIAAVFGYALVNVLAMLAVWGIALSQDGPMSLNPGILAGAMLFGALQAAKALPVSVPLGALLHVALIRTGQTGLPPYVGAGVLVAAVSALALGLVDGFAFNGVFAVMCAVSGVLGGFLFWMARRPDRNRTATRSVASSGA